MLHCLCIEHLEGHPLNTSPIMSLVNPRTNFQVYAILHILKYIQLPPLTSCCPRRPVIQHLNGLDDPVLTGRHRYANETRLVGPDESRDPVSTYLLDHQRLSIPAFEDSTSYYKISLLKIKVELDKYVKQLL